MVKLISQNQNSPSEVCECECVCKTNQLLTDRRSARQRSRHAHCLSLHVTAELLNRIQGADDKDHAVGSDILTKHN